MVVNSIKVFARLKQEKCTSEKFYDISKENLDELSFYTSACNQYGNTLRFRFHKVFDQDVSQNEVFFNVAKPVVNSVLQGINGTIFAYGQTGSGKTYSITGSPKTYQDRGIIPRSVQDIFANIEKVEDKPIIYISYMEIYNEICYDLLHAKESKSAIRLEELPKVVVLEDKKGKPRLRNLSILPVSTEEEAMRLLFLGDTNRTIAETPMNEYSSRSHCIFTIYITYRGKGMKTRFSKLNLVDLAGSERVYKSQIAGTILTEAKHINLSLHFLQQVILALSESKRVHIPYRNSVMTFILKDSLAGNCLTVMLATLAVTKANMQETISTCKFAQRVSMIKTEPIINEIHDPLQEIEILRYEILELQKQLTKEREVRSSIDINLNETVQDLPNTEKIKCEEIVERFLKQSEEKPINIEANFAHIQYCFALLKKKVVSQAFPINMIKVNDNYCREIGEDNPIKKYNYYNYLNSSIDQFKNFAKEIEYYITQLNKTYEKAKCLAKSIDECQKNILFIRKKLDGVHKKDFHQKILLTKELEYQQNIYKRSIVDLKEVKNETLHLQSKLQKAELLKSQNEQEIKLMKYSMGKLNQINNQYDNDKLNYRYENTDHSYSVEDYLSCTECKHICNDTINDRRKCHPIKTPKNMPIACNCEDCKSKVKSCSENEHLKLSTKINHYKREISAVKSKSPLFSSVTTCDCENCELPKIYHSKKNCKQGCCHTKENIISKTTSREKGITSGEENFRLQFVPDKLTYEETNFVHLSCSELKLQQEQICTNESNRLNEYFSSDNERCNNFGVYSAPSDKLQNYLREEPCANQRVDLLPIETKLYSEYLKNTDSVYDDNFKEVVESPKELDSIFKTTDSKDFRDFMKSIPLTGDLNINQEICEFYRDKFG